MTLLGVGAHPDWRTTSNPSYWRLCWVKEDTHLRRTGKLEFEPSFLAEVPTFQAIQNPFEQVISLSTVL